jgi:hypothetical protein
MSGEISFSVVRMNTSPLGKSEDFVFEFVRAMRIRDEKSAIYRDEFDGCTTT